MCFQCFQKKKRREVEKKNETPFREPTGPSVSLSLSLVFITLTRRRDLTRGICVPCSSLSPRCLREWSSGAGFISLEDNDLRKSCSRLERPVMNVNTVPQPGSDKTTSQTPTPRRHPASLVVDRDDGTTLLLTGLLSASWTDMRGGAAIGNPREEQQQSGPADTVCLPSGLARTAAGALFS